MTKIPPGINWQESRQRFQVRAYFCGERVHVGRYKTLEEAKRALADARQAYSAGWI